MLQKIVYQQPNAAQTSSVLSSLSHHPCHLFTVRLPPARAPDEQASHYTCGHRDAAHDGNAHQTLLRDAVVDECLQAAGLEIGRLEVEQQLVVTAGLGIVAELVVAKRKVVKAFATALGAVAKDLGEEAHAFLLLTTLRGFDEALERRK